MLSAPELSEDNYSEILSHCDYRTQLRARSVSHFFKDKVTKIEPFLLKTSQVTLVERFLNEFMDTLPEFNGFSQETWSTKVLPELNEKYFTLQLDPKIKSYLDAVQPGSSSKKIFMQSDRLNHYLGLSVIYYQSKKSLFNLDFMNKDTIPLLFDVLPAKNLGHLSIRALLHMYKRVLDVENPIDLSERHKASLERTLRDERINIIQTPYCQLENRSQRNDFIISYISFPQNIEREGLETFNRKDYLKHQSSSDLDRLIESLGRTRRTEENAQMLNEVQTVLDERHRAEHQSRPSNGL